jgi:anti-anti-sigma factor
VLQVEARSSASFCLSGELDLATVDDLRAAFAPLDGINTRIVLDVRDLEFMDCAGLHAIVDMASRLGPDGRVVLLGARGCVARLINTLGIADAVNVDVVPC